MPYNQSLTDPHTLPCGCLPLKNRKRSRGHAIKREWGSPHPYVATLIKTFLSTGYLSKERNIESNIDLN